MFCVIMGVSPTFLSLAVAIDANMEMIADYSVTISWFPWKPGGGVYRRSSSVGWSSNPSAWTYTRQSGMQVKDFHVVSLRQFTSLLG